jgi:flagellar motor switch protein FliG
MGIFKPRKPKQDTTNMTRGIAAYQNTLTKESVDSRQQSAAPMSAVDFLKADKLLKRGPEEAKPGEGEKESKSRKVAKFLILIGAEEASQILSHLDPKQVEAISREIATIRGISAEEAASIAMEFRSLLSASYGYSPSATGGVEAARKILHRAFGKDKGEAVLNRTLPESTENPFGFLEDFSEEQLSAFLKDESPATEALVLSRLSARLSAKLLAASPKERKIEVIRRIGRLKETPLEVLQQVAAGFREKAERMEHVETMDIDGMNTLTAILKSADPSFGDTLLQQLWVKDPSLSLTLKERLHTFDDVIKAQDRAIQEKLLTMSDRDLVLLLKNRSNAFIEKILFNMSAERRIHIREETDILGPVRKRDADAVARDFLDWFRAGREAGRILLLDDEDIIV